MFPLIPALLLLLLQGQAPVERGRVPGTFESLPWQIVARQIEADANGARPPIAQVCALLRLLTPRAEPAPAESERAVSNAAKVVPSPAARLARGFARTERARDGPLFSS